MRPKVLITDTFPLEFREAIGRLPVSMKYMPNVPKAEILVELQDAQVLILNSGINVDRATIDAGPRLEMIIRAGVGMDHFDLPYLSEKGIKVLNTKGGNAESVGEQTVGMLLAMRHWVVRADKQMREFRFMRHPNRATEIRGKTIGLIGYGFTGKAVARKLSGFGCRVLVYDKYLQNYGDQYASEASMEEIFAQAEILSFHIPLTEETHYLADADFFASFSQPIWFLNLARGEVTHLPSLLGAMDKGEVVAAALDVLEHEKKLEHLPADQQLIFEELFSRDNVIVTPHIGGWSWESLAEINGRIVQYVEDWLAGR
ncbi:MAG: NAD(P)-dependent oxidoreductase [Bacteroidota bacterium]